MTKALFHLRQFRLLLLVLLCALFSLPLSAREKETYVKESIDGTTLTFYYNNDRDWRSGKTWGINSWEGLAWAGTYNSPNERTKRVVFDASFKNFLPTTTRGWFYKLSALTTIEGLENLNTSAVTDMGGMFSGCSSLTSLNLSNFNTSKVTNMSWMFSGCSSLSSLNLSNFNTSAVTDMSYMFSGCSSLTSLNVSNFNTSKVTEMKGMFSGCSSLTSLNVSNFNTSAMTDMSYMFSGCSGLTSLNLSNFNTSKVTDMSEMFSGCSSLKTILNANTWRCRGARDMFKGCTQLKGAVKYNYREVDVSMANPNTGYFTDSNPRAYVLQSEDKQTLTFYYDVNRAFRSGETWGINEKYNSSQPAWVGDYPPNEVVTKVVLDASFKNFLPTTTRGWFYKLSALTTIEELENLNTSAVTDMSEMFSGCSDLKELNVSNFNTSAVTNMVAIFRGCSKLTSLNISNFNTSAVTNMDGMFENCSGLTSLNVSNFNTSAVKNMSGMFSHCSGLKSLNLSNFNTSAVTDMSDMFSGCSRLKQLNVSNFNTSAVTNMSKMFFGCSNLTSLNLSNFNTSTVTNMNWMFFGCSNLTSLNLSNFNTSKVTDMGAMFLGCSRLTSLNLSNFNTSAVTNMSWMFKNCSGLTSLNLSNFNTSKVTDMSYMFYKSSGLTSLNLSNFNTSAVTNMSAMFRECSSLKTIFNSNTWRCRNSDDMFDGCKQLRGAVKYNDNKVDAEMANPATGYFADPNPRAYVLLSEDERTLTFFYDVNRAFRSDKTWDIDEKKYKNSDKNEEVPAWAGTYNSPNKVVTKVTFDASFKDFRPTTTNYWFYNLKALTTIEGLKNLNTSAVTDMSDMFSGCSGLKELNVSKFNTSAVTDMSNMFSGCSDLKELNVSNFNTAAVTDMGWMFSGCSGLKTIINTQTWRCELSQDMFKGCTQLKGAVKYDESKVDATMANPTTGYFSQKLPSAIGRVVFDDNNATQIYTLQGKRVNANQRHLPAGFYIVNGKKVYLNEKP